MFRMRFGLACAAALAPLAAQTAEPPPVQAGLWDVRLLTTFERKATLSTAAEPPRARSYRICIGPDRARAPMLPGRLPPRTELLFDRQSVSFSYAEAASAGAGRQVDFSYRRLDAATFEGSFDQSAAGLITRTQYLARHVAADCGALKPSVPGPLGEP